MSMVYQWISVFLFSKRTPRDDGLFERKVAVRLGVGNFPLVVLLPMQLHFRV